MVVEKLHGICKGFSKSLEDGGSWIQFDLEDSQLLEQFGKYHEKHIPFKDIETEKTLFLACLVNVECIAKGQLISGRNFDIFKSSKKRTKFLKDFCPSL